MNTLPKKIKLMPDYECWCLWDIEEPDNINPETLPISDNLKILLADWEAAYDATLNHDNPAASGFSSNEDFLAFNETGWELFEHLKRELPEVSIYYFDSNTSKLHEQRPVA